jgi:hypothetical protein
MTDVLSSDDHGQTASWQPAANGADNEDGTT